MNVDILCLFLLIFYCLFVEELKVGKSCEKNFYFKESVIIKESKTLKKEA
jgi:hypothetical protein